MALLYIDGFDWITNGVLLFDGGGRYSTSGTIPSQFDRITDTASGTGAAARLQGSANLIRALDNEVTIYIGCRVRIGSIPISNTNLFSYREATATSGLHLSMLITTSGTIQVRRGNIGGTLLGTTTTALTANTWTYIECKVTISDTVGVVEIRFNGSATPDLNLTSQDTKNGGNTYCDGFFFGGNNINLDFDDFYIDTTTFHGDVEVTTIVPDGAGASAQFTPSAGSNWQNVDELPVDNDTTYNESNTVAHKDRFTFGNLPADADTVIGVQVSAFAKKQIAGPRDMRLVAFDGTTEGDGALTHTPAVGDYSWFVTMFEDHPSGAAAWTTGEVDGGQFGYKIQA